MSFRQNRLLVDPATSPQHSSREASATSRPSSPPSDLFHGMTVQQVASLLRSQGWEVSPPVSSEPRNTRVLPEPTRTVPATLTPQRYHVRGIDQRRSSDAYEYQGPLSQTWRMLENQARSSPSARLNAATQATSTYPSAFTNYSRGANQPVSARHLYSGYAPIQPTISPRPSQARPTYTYVPPPETKWSGQGRDCLPNQIWQLENQVKLYAATYWNVPLNGQMAVLNMSQLLKDDGLHFYNCEILPRALEDPRFTTEMAFHLLRNRFLDRDAHRRAALAFESVTQSSDLDDPNRPNVHQLSTEIQDLASQMTEITDIELRKRFFSALDIDYQWEIRCRIQGDPVGFSFHQVLKLALEAERSVDAQRHATNALQSEQWSDNDPDPDSNPDTNTRDRRTARSSSWRSQRNTSESDNHSSRDDQSSDDQYQDQGTEDDWESDANVIQSDDCDDDNYSQGYSDDGYSEAENSGPLAGSSQHHSNINSREGQNRHVRSNDSNTFQGNSHTTRNLSRPINRDLFHQSRTRSNVTNDRHGITVHSCHIAEENDREQDTEDDDGPEQE